MIRAKAMATQVAQEMNMDPIMIGSIVLSLLDCLKNDEDRNTPEQQLAHTRVLANYEPVRIYRAAKRFARQHGVPIYDRDRVAKSVVDRIRSTGDAELMSVFDEK